MAAAVAGFVRSKLLMIRRKLAAIRAALLLNDQLSSDALFRHDHTTLELKDALREALPRSTPEEARLEMKPVPFDFWLFTSTER